MDPQQINTVLTEALPTAGVGGALALIMFWFYRQDRRDTMEKFEQMTKRHVEKFEQMTRRHEELVERHEKSSELWVTIVKENTQAMTKLVERIGMMR